MEEKIILGIDVGGTHITCACINLESERIIQETRTEISVNSNGSAGEIADTFRLAIKESCAHGVTPSGIGVAMPGPFDYENGICKMAGVGKYDSIYDYNIRELFSKASGITGENILFMNDAACFALGEYFAGAGRGAKRMAAITLGTGFGSSFIAEERLVTAGENVPMGGMFWNVSYKNGIADDYFSTRWFVENYKLKTGREIKGVIDLIPGFNRDKDAQNLFNEFAHSLSWFLLPWLKLFEAERLVIGGSIAKAEEFFVPLMQYTFAEEKCGIEVVHSKLDNNSALIGAANLFK